MTMGERIKYLREHNNMTQDELGVLLGVQKSAIAKYESGKVENIKRSTIKKMADLFGVSACFLMGFDVDENQEKIFSKETTIYYEIQNQWGVKVAEAVSILIHLNDDGLDKALSSLDMISEIPKYRKEDDS